MKIDTRKQDATGTSTGRLITQGRAGHGWQDFDSTNDNGIDSMIILRKNGIDTGEILFAQVKCGGNNGYMLKTKNRPDEFGVKVGRQYIAEHRPKWNRLSAPIILIYVDFESQKAWWTDLRDESSYTDSNKDIILIKNKQRFEEHSFGEFRKLNGRVFVSPEIDQLSVLREELSYIKANKSIKECAKLFYRKWSNAPVEQKRNPVLGDIIVSRVGWRHLTRTNRKQERLVSSFMLMSIAKKMIINSKKFYNIRQLSSTVDPISNSRIIIDYIALKNHVSFPTRQASLVQVILKRVRKIASNGDVETRIWFYSVYEPLALATKKHH